MSTLLSSPPLSTSVLKSLQELHIHTEKELSQTGVIPTFLLLKTAGLTITRSVLWQLWAIVHQCKPNELTDKNKKELLALLKKHPPVAIFPNINQMELFMWEALKEAQKAYDLKEIPIGSVITLNNKVIARGYNRSLTDYYICAHAELIAIKEASLLLNNYRLEGCDLYTTVEPCPMCASAIIQSRINRVIIGAMEPRTGAAGSIINLFSDRKINSHSAIYTNILTDECSKIMQQFFSKKRKNDRFEESLE